MPDAAVSFLHSLFSLSSCGALEADLQTPLLTALPWTTRRPAATASAGAPVDQPRVWVCEEVEAFAECRVVRPDRGLGQPALEPVGVGEFGHEGSGLPERGVAWRPRARATGRSAVRGQVLCFHQCFLSASGMPITSHPCPNSTSGGRRVNAGCLRRCLCRLPTESPPTGASPNARQPGPARSRHQARPRSRRPMLSQRLRPGVARRSRPCR